MMYINISSLNGNRYWFWDIAFFSDWKNKPCDYSTNVVVHNFYNNNKTNWWRTNKYKEFYKINNYYIPKEVGKNLSEKDTLIIGLDKYALMGVSRDLVPQEILQQYKDKLNNDKVIRCRVYINNNKIIWEIENAN